MKPQALKRISWAISFIIAFFVLYANPQKAFTQSSDPWEEYNQILQLIESYAKDSNAAPPKLQQQCNNGQHNILQILNLLRLLYPDLMRNWRYAAVELMSPDRLNGGHQGVAIYRDPGSSSADAHYNALMNCYGVVHYTNGMSNAFGGFQYSNNNFFRTHYLQLSTLPPAGYYFNGIYPNPQPLKTATLDKPRGAVECKSPCIDCLTPTATTTVQIRTVVSRDPNEKVGSQGISDPRYVSGKEALRYSVFFENVASATAPAQEVMITDQLDPATMDLGTFSLGAISFGDSLITPPQGLKQYLTNLDLRPAKDLIVTVEAGINAETGLITWRFTSIDPATGQLPDDPLLGFLPPNVNPPQGEGGVVFTVMPKPGLATGTEIHNHAAVIFDVNPPIVTNDWLNTVDSTKPLSQVLPLPPTQSTTSFTVQWTGSDVHSGMLDYSIYVSTDSGPFAFWLILATDTSATFSGENGHTYAFYSVATDRVSNTEDAKTVPDATTGVGTKLITPVNDSQAGRVIPDCTLGCWYDSGASLNLLAVTASGHVFDHWSVDCTGTNPSVSVSLTALRTCTANFLPCADMPVMIDTGYPSLGASYLAAKDDDIIKMLATNLQETLIFDRQVRVTLLGGFSCEYEGNPSFTLLEGQLIIKAGTAILEKLLIF